MAATLEGVSQLHQVLVGAVSHLHMYCQKNLSSTAGKFDIKGRVSLDTGSTASVEFYTSEDGLTIVTEPDLVEEKQGTSLAGSSGSILEDSQKSPQSPPSKRQKRQSEPRSNSCEPQSGEDSVSDLPAAPSGPGIEESSKNKENDLRGKVGSADSKPVPPSPIKSGLRSTSKRSVNGKTKKPQMTKSVSSITSSGQDEETLHERRGADGCQKGAALNKSARDSQQVAAPVEIKMEPEALRRSKRQRAIKSRDKLSRWDDHVYSVLDLEYSGTAKEKSSESTPSKPDYVHCGLCQEGFTNQESMWQHINTTHAIHVPSETKSGELEKRFRCDVCDKSYKDFYQLKHHRKSHSGEVTNLCPHCGKSFILPSTLNRHILNKHVTPFRCEHCMNVFQSKQTLDKHMVDRHGENTWMCELCGKLCVTEALLKKHVARQHKDGRTLQCDHCQVSFKTFLALKRHQESHLGLKLHKCVECNRRFSTATSLKYHQKLHSGERRYKCNMCNTQFDHLSQVKVHARIHTGEKPFVCTECGQAFRIMNSLKRHMQGHSGERTHVCFVCEKKFFSKSSCSKHVRKLHPEAKAFACLACNERFSSKSELNEHSTVHMDLPLLEGGKRESLQGQGPEVVATEQGQRSLEENNWETTVLIEQPLDMNSQDVTIDSTDDNREAILVAVQSIESKIEISDVEVILD